MRTVYLLPLISAFIFSSAQAREVEPKPQWSIIEKKLTKAKFKPSFIAEMKSNYEKKHFAEIVRLNVMLFLRKSNYHAEQATPEAAKKVAGFMRKYRTTFAKAEAKYKVPPSVVSSLLWIESRHGQNQGDFHVPSVYLHLLQADRPDVIKYYDTQAYRFTDKSLTKKDRAEFKKRGKEKVAFAIAQLRALQKVHQWKWKLGKEFRGSYAGAFGMAQFLPSSYIAWARSAHPPAQPMLSKPDDAIHSVAHYLRDHGWGKKLTKIEALMKYNKSRDYAEAILDLADQVTPAVASNDKIRAPAGKAKK